MHFNQLEFSGELTHGARLVRRHEIGAVLDEQLRHLEMALVRGPKKRHLPPLRKPERVLLVNMNPYSRRSAGNDGEAGREGAPHRES